MGPYDYMRDTLTEPLIADIDATPVTARTAVTLAHLMQACQDAGIDLGEYDTRTLDWIARTWEPWTAQVLIGLISRANKPS